jgi:signal transduction histidine kinase
MIMAVRLTPVLSIVRSVAVAHRGQVTATPGPPEGGLEVLVLLPDC